VQVSTTTRASQPAAAIAAPMLCFRTLRDSSLKTARV